MRAILAIVGIALFSMIAIMGFNAALADNQQRTDITNESFTPDAGNVTELQDSRLDAATYDDDSNVTVYNASDVEMTEGTDYEWFQENGTLKTLSGGDLEGDATANVSYGYDRPPADQVMLSQVLSQIPRTIGALLPVFALLFLLLIVRGS